MSEPIHVVITRTVKPGCEAAFEKALHDFVQSSLALEGQLGVQIIRPVPGTASRQYGIIRKFSDRAAIQAFRVSPEYLAWNHHALELTEGAGRVEELCGLESWFTPPGQTLQPLPRWKMALTTYLGVLPTVVGLNLLVGTSLNPLGFWGRNVVFNALVVALLTWAVMPLITRALHRWLHRPQNS